MCYAGTAQWDPELCRLRQVIVDQKYRGLGVGTKLVRSVFHSAVQAGKCWVLVNAWQESVQFYSKMGFTEVGSLYISGDKKVTCQKMKACTTNFGQKK